MADDDLDIDKIRDQAKAMPLDGSQVRRWALEMAIPALCDEVERLRSQLDCDQLDGDDWREGFAKGALESILGLEGDDE